jgi:hypothetical protein
MKVKIKTLGKNYIELSVPIGTPLDEFDKVIYKVLLLALLEKPVYLITLTPQKYSLGYDYNEPIKIKTSKHTLLVNFIDSCSADLLKEIVESEEFERGLLRLVTVDQNRLNDIIGEVFFEFINDNDISKVNIGFELITCEADGKMLCWFNPHIPIHILEAKLKEISNIIVET